MVDIETMSTHNSNALILSVGAVLFEMQEIGPKFIEEKHWALPLGEQLIAGRHVDPATQKWWSEQSLETQGLWMNSFPVSSIPEFRKTFEDWIANPDELWANGVVFDIGNLASLWPGNPPWSYSCVRDSRTVRKLMPETRTLPEMDERPHEPVADCRTQIRDLWRRGIG
jgi:hypothetical protein